MEFYVNGAKTDTLPVKDSGQYWSGGTSFGYSVNSVPEYYWDGYLQERLESAKPSYTNGKSFIWISDVHLLDNACKSKYLIPDIMKRLNIDKVVFTGDIITTYGTQEDMDRQIEEWNDFVNCIGRDKIYCGQGNHDLCIQYVDDERNPLYKGYGAPISEINDTLMGDMIRANKISYVDTEHQYYSWEDDDMLYIMLNSFECINPGSGWLDPSNTRHTPAIYQEQINWLIDLLLNSTKKIVMFSHQTWVPSLHENGNGYYPYMNNLISAYTGRTSVSYESDTVSFNADFSGCTGELICVFTGHVHGDEGNNSNGCANISITADAMYGSGQTKGTVSEQAFDIVNIDYDKKVIWLYRIGWYGNFHNRRIGF